MYNVIKPVEVVINYGLPLLARHFGNEHLSSESARAHHNRMQPTVGGSCFPDHRIDSSPIGDIQLVDSCISAESPNPSRYSIGDVPLAVIRESDVGARPRKFHAHRLPNATAATND